MNGDVLYSVYCGVSFLYILLLYNYYELESMFTSPLPLVCFRETLGKLQFFTIRCKVWSVMLSYS